MHPHASLKINFGRSLALSGLALSGLTLSLSLSVAQAQDAGMDSAASANSAAANSEPVPPEEMSAPHQRHDDLHPEDHDGHEHDGHEHDGHEHDGHEHDGHEHDGPERNGRRHGGHRHAGDTCSGSAFSSASDALVIVEANGEKAFGVHIGEGNIVTTWSILRDGHGIQVKNVQGDSAPAHISAIDSDHDLALIELNQALPNIGSVELARDAFPEMGTQAATVFANVSLFREAPRFRHSVALADHVISSTSEADFHLAPAPERAGAAVVSCDGSLLGVAAHAHSSGHMQGNLIVRPVAQIRALLARRGEDRGYDGRWRLRLGAGGAVSYEPSTTDLWGFYGFVGLTGLDWFMVAARVESVRASQGPIGDVAGRSFDRLRIDPYVAVRLFVNPFPGYKAHFELGAGASFQWRWFNQDTVALGGTPPTTVGFVHQRAEQFTVMPHANLTYVVQDCFEIGYRIHLDVDRANIEAIHSGFAGFRM